MLTLQQRILLIVGSIVLIITLIVLYILYGRTAPATNTTLPSNTTNTKTNTETVGQKIDQKPVEEKIVLPPYSEEVYVKQLSRTFVERYASYSSQNPNINIDDTLVLASPELQAWLKTQRTEFTRDYKGVVTEVLASRVLEKTATTANVHIEVQQTLESKAATAVGATTKEIKQRTGRVTLVKSGDRWLVDGLYWDKE